MKYLKYSCLLILLLCFACEKEMDIVEEVTSFPNSTEATIEKIEGRIFRSGSFCNPTRPSNFIPHATVKLIHDGLVLDEVKAAVTGGFSFEEQLIPKDKTFIYVEALDFFPTIRRIDNVTLGNDIDLIPKYYKGINDHSFDEEKPMIEITGNVVDFEKGYFIYALDANGDLIGHRGAEYVEHSDTLKLSTMAGEEIYLYARKGHNNTVSSLKIGPFTEDTDIGDVLLFENLTQPLDLIIEGSVEACNGVQDTRGDIYLFQDDQIRGSGVLLGDNHITYTCGGNLSNTPITLIASYQKPMIYEYTDYSKTITTYIPGQDIVASIEKCYPNPSLVTYSINGSTSFEDRALAIANIKEMGEVNVSMFNGYYGRNFYFKLSGSEIGSQTGSIFLNEYFNFIGFADNVAFTITANDGEVLEGNFQGTLMDENYINIGDVEGSFKAVIK